MSDCEHEPDLSTIRYEDGDIFVDCEECGVTGSVWFDSYSVSWGEVDE